MKNPQREIIVICRNLRGYSLILPKMNVNLNHTHQKQKTTKGVRLSKCVKEQKKGTSGPGGARARFLTKDSTWPTTHHSTIKIIQSKKQPSGVERAVQVGDFFVQVGMGPPLKGSTVAIEVDSTAEPSIITASSSVSSFFSFGCFPESPSLFFSTGHQKESKL